MDLEVLFVYISNKGIRSEMSDVSGDGDLSATVTEHEVTPQPPVSSATYPSLTVSASYKESSGGKSSSKRRPIRPSFDAAADNEFITLLHGSDPVKVELNRLENEVRGLIMLFDFFIFCRFGF
jgi:hypothetical protein